ncbi:general secretion pathway protein M [Alcanivorax hongdengensis A-11-3]|uniref:Type II secretion system protein M n=1 Tax=Alcanivorax hongdengensis A-11-3 TaxID=1177179 RepID=L0WBW4_9GAMM|nr:type II secretion system protein GspM [Alcanivorax hongdengensis]EKF73587.1 general secretion pathway protein M [Alcanivorax hongdengensis A-11-3]
MNVAQLKTTAAQRLAPVQQWYESREPREQRVLQVLALVMALVLLYWLLWAPSMAAREKARQRYIANTQTLEWISDNAEAVRAATRGSDRNAPPGNWVSNVSRSADQYGLTLKGFSPQGNQSVRIQLENQPAAQTVLWLQSMVSQGLELASIEMSPGDKPGTSTLRATLQQ